MEIKIQRCAVEAALLSGAGALPLISHKTVQPLQSSCQSQSVLSRIPLIICVTRELNLFPCEL